MPNLLNKITANSDQTQHTITIYHSDIFIILYNIHVSWLRCHKKYDTIFFSYSWHVYYKKVVSTFYLFFFFFFPRLHYIVHIIFSETPLHSPYKSNTTSSLSIIIKITCQYNIQNATLMDRLKFIIFKKITKRKYLGNSLKQLKSSISIEEILANYLRWIFFWSMFPWFLHLLEEGLSN